MEDTEIISLWKTQNHKIEQSLSVNKLLLTEIISQKAQTVLQTLIRFKSRGIIAAVIYLILLGTILLYALTRYSPAENYFIISMAAIFLINLKALYDYVKHIVWINNINYDGSITEIQQKLTKLQLSIISHTRIMVLQFPLWTTFYLSSSWFPQEIGLGYIIFQLTLTTSFTYLAYWLYKNISIVNMDKKIVKIFVEGSGGKQVKKALAFYKEMEGFNKDA